MKANIIMFFLLLSTAITQVIAQQIRTQVYAHSFKTYDACFIIYDMHRHKIVSEYNPNHYCDKRIAADSTFKIALSLMAFNEGVIHPSSVFQWDGQKRNMPGWDQDQTPRTWLQYSVVWVSQRLTPKLGYACIQHYLQVFHYGNEDFSGDPGAHNGLTHAWLSSSLKISAFEQLHFLNAMLTYQLPVSRKAITATETNLYQGKLDNGVSYYGKTGSGRHGQNERERNPSKLRDGWYVGFIDQGNDRYIFVSNLTDKAVPTKPHPAYGSSVLKPIVLQLLNEYF